MNSRINISYRGVHGGPHGPGFQRRRLFQNAVQFDQPLTAVVVS